ncbi:MAG TPA: protoglobin domain-containing protein [Kineosporiaceae bacterium]|nr:protoglobin domain-containing protein [Kineosporiaceae bacterium]
MREIAQMARDQLPPACRFTPEDALVIGGYSEVLLALEPDVVKAFYDTLYAHGPTAAVFVDGERPDRETTLSQWWRRTVIGPLDDGYFDWMAMVGLVHVIRGVTNPMMLAMAEFTVTFVAGKAAEADIDEADAARLVEAFRRLASTVGAIITCGYDQAVVAALYNVAGMPEALLRRLRNQEIAEALTVARGELHPPEG